jgi:hypothetical protein
VVLVTFLCRLRTLWLKHYPQHDTPPIIVLAYKNHALDEFAVDLLKRNPKLNPIRAGSSDNPKLGRYLERQASNQASVTAAEVKVKSAYTTLQNVRKSGHEDHESFAMEVGAEPIKAVHRMLCRLRHLLVLVNEGKENPFESSDEELPAKLATFVKAKPERAAKILSAFEESCKLKPNKASALAALAKSGPVIKEKCDRCAGGFLPGLALPANHYRLPEVDVLDMWYKGQKPQPQCLFGEAEDRCTQLANTQSPYCPCHRCKRCPKSVDLDAYCTEHQCAAADCPKPRLPEAKNSYCDEHTCFKCLEAGQRPSLATLGSPPLQVCELHRLCISDDPEPCTALALAGKPYCSEHNTQTCSHEEKGKRCRKVSLAPDVPFCAEHKPATKANPATKAPTSPGGCAARNRKNKPCQGKPLSAGYCRAHLALAAQAGESQAEPLPSPPAPSVAPTGPVEAATRPEPEPGKMNFALILRNTG